MARIPRVTQNIFASTPGTNQVTEFGSTYNGTPVYSTNISTIQSLSNWLTGWYNAAIAQSAPIIQDMNAVFLVITTQIAYLLQAGIAEWDAGTTYYTGDIVQDGSGVIYVSIANSNLNNAVANNPSFWILTSLKAQTAPASVTIPAGYNLNSGFLTVPSGVTYTVAGSLVCAHSLIASGTGVIQATGTGIIYNN